MNEQQEITDLLIEAGAALGMQLRHEHCPDLIQRLADALAKLSDPAYRLVKAEDLEDALLLAKDAGVHAEAFASGAKSFPQAPSTRKWLHDIRMKEARTLVGLDEEEG